VEQCPRDLQRCVPRRWTSSLVSTNNHEPDIEGLARSFANPSGIKRIVEQTRKVKSMKRICMTIAALALLMVPMQATAQDKLVVSVWGGSWRDMVDNLIGKKFTAATGVPVEYITGGTIDRLNKEKLAKGNPESDITFTT
jgi:hypothetical protein